MVKYYEKDLRKHYEKIRGVITEEDIITEFRCLHCTFISESEKRVQNHIIKKHKDWLREKGHIH